jgi:hypothetical protein
VEVARDCWPTAGGAGTGRERKNQGPFGINGRGQAVSRVETRGVRPHPVRPGGGGRGEQRGGRAGSQGQAVM